MRNIIIIVILVIVLGAAFYFTRQYIQNNPGGFFGRGNSITINEQKIDLLFAKTQEERETGLSGRESLGENQGMLFTFDRPGFYSFWMQDMKFPIDIIFINGDKVVTIYENVPPPAAGETLTIYKPEEPADKVLELNANKAQELKLQKGATIELPNN